MKPFRWSAEKNERLKEERGVSFESIVVAIESGGLLDILAQPNQSKYPRQRALVVSCDNYVYLVPFVEEGGYFFLKTVIPSRKATRDYLKQGEADAKD
ncbi:MAG: toxin [Thermodesulfobacteriota bacterium]